MAEKSGNKFAADAIRFLKLN